MRYLSVEEVIELHDREVPHAPVIDMGRLDSAVAAPQHTFNGADVLPDIHAKAAALMRSLVMNHCFQDGNKRAAVLSVYAFYGFNGYLLIADQAALIHLAVDIAVDHYDIEKIADYLRLWGQPIPDPFE